MDEEKSDRREKNLIDAKAEPYVPPSSELLDEESKETFSSPLRRKTTAQSSNFFSLSTERKASSIRFPEVEAPSFGLAQEKFANDPFKLMVIVIFLTKTKGSVSIPVCQALFEKYPGPAAFATAKAEDIAETTRSLGLQNKRSKLLIELAKAWVKKPPVRGCRYRHKHYPYQGDGQDINVSEEPISDEDPRTAWEIAHLPGTGEYMLDSWRIFCRDALRGIPSGLRDISGDRGIGKEMNQEWTRVVPRDKELRAYLQWRWLRLGYLWNPLDGERIKVDKHIIQKMQKKELPFYKKFKNPWLLESTPNEPIKDEVQGRMEVKQEQEEVSQQEQHLSKGSSSQEFKSPQRVHGPSQNHSSQSQTSQLERKAVDAAIDLLQGDRMIEALSKPGI